MESCDGIAYIRFILLFSFYTLYGCLYYILFWSIGHLWSLVTSSCREHKNGGYLFARYLVLKEYSFQTSEMSMWFLDLLSGGLHLAWGFLGWGSGYVGVAVREEEHELGGGLEFRNLGGGALNFGEYHSCLKALYFHLCHFGAWQRSAFYNPVENRCVTRYVLILELTRVLYKK